MATQSQKDGAQTHHYRAARKEAERVRGMLRDDGMVDPFVLMLGDPYLESPPRVYVILEDLNMTAVDLLRDSNYRMMGVDDGEVTLIRKYTA